MEAGLGFAHRQHGNGIDVFAAPLGVGIEIAHGIQFVSKEFRTDGLIGGRGEDIDDSAPDGELSAALYHAAAAIACRGELADQVLQGVFLPHLQGKGRAHQHRGRHGTKAEGFPGQNLKGRSALGQVIELPQPFLFPGTGYHGSVVKGQLPAGENGGRFSQKALQFLLHSPGGHVVLAQDNHGPVQIPAQTRDHMTAVDLSDSGDGGAFPGLQGGRQGGVFGYGFEQG